MEYGTETKLTALDEFKSTLFVKIGSATMCWNPKPTGVFDSSSAQKYGEQIFDTVKNNTPLAIQILTQALKDEDYRRSWVASIAMSFKDEYHREFEKSIYTEYKDAPHTIHVIANTAAENFINLLCMDSND